MLEDLDRLVLDAIVGGECDHILDVVIDSVADRRAILARRMLRQLEAGDMVRFGDQISPKYLIGLTVTVTKVNRKSVIVSVPNDPLFGRFRGKRSIRVPLSLIEAVNDQDEEQDSAEADFDQEVDLDEGE